MKIGIIGVGNILFGDEGLGTLFTKCMGELIRNEKIVTYPLGVEVLDILHIMYLEKYDLIILIDCGKIDKEFIIYELRDDIEDKIINDLINLETFSSHSESPIQILVKSIFLRKDRPKVYILLFKPENMNLLGNISEKSINNLLRGFETLLKLLNLNDILDDYLKNMDNIRRCVIEEFNRLYEYLLESH